MRWNIYIYIKKGETHKIVRLTYAYFPSVTILQNKYKPEKKSIILQFNTRRDTNDFHPNEKKGNKKLTIPAAKRWKTPGVFLALSKPARPDGTGQGTTSLLETMQL